MPKEGFWGSEALLCMEGSAPWKGAPVGANPRLYHTDSPAGLAEEEGGGREAEEGDDRDWVVTPPPLGTWLRLGVEHLASPSPQTWLALSSPLCRRGARVQRDPRAGLRHTAS